jgi:DTW domain-containing protein YfiP
VLQNLTRVELVLHHNEADKPTNTGRLACLALQNSRIRVRGLRDQPMPTDGLQNAVILSPHEHSTLLSSGPSVLIVPDGTWNQVGRMVRREPVLAGLPRVHLGQVQGSPLQIRAASRQDGLSTLEAIAEALELLGEQDNAQALRRLFEVFATAVLASRGTLRET